MHDRQSRFAPFPGAMKIPPASLYPTRPLPYLWRVVLEVERDGGTLTARWENYATSSTDATTRAIEWMQDEAAAIADQAPGERRGQGVKFRVLEVLQASI